MPYLFVVALIIAFISTATWHYLKPSSSPGHKRLRTVAEVVSMACGFLVVAGSCIAMGDLLSLFIADGAYQFSEPDWRDGAFVMGAVSLGTLATFPVWIGAEALAGKVRIKYPLNSN